MQTAIPTTGRTECPKCGGEFIVDVATCVGKCQCGHRCCYQRQRNAEPEDLLTALGYELSIDYDGSLLVDSEDEIPEAILEWIFRDQREFRERIERRGRNERAVFIGGSMAGRKHGHYLTCFTQQVYEHIKRAHWETYEFRGRKDPRLYFVGTATSKAKARRLGSATPL